MYQILLYGFGPVALRGIVTILSETPARISTLYFPEEVMSLLPTAMLDAVIVDADFPGASAVVDAARSGAVVICCSATDTDVVVFPRTGGEPRTAVLTETVLVQVLRSLP